MEGETVRRSSGRLSAESRRGRQIVPAPVDLHEIVVQNAVDLESKKRKTTMTLPTDEDDDDFVNPPQRKNAGEDYIQQEPRNKRTSVCPRTQEDDDEDDDDDDDFADTRLQQLSTRFPAVRLTDFVSGLNNTQKTCLQSIGFGSVLKLKIESFSKTLAFWVVDNYNPDTNSICFYNKTINVTKERVHEIYGIPMGTEEMMVPKNNKHKNKMLALWKSQFSSSLKRPRLTHIIQKLKGKEIADELFVLNFLVLFVNVMVQSTSMGDVNKQFLKYIPNIESVKDLDWCGLVMSSLKASKKVWAPNEKKSFYTGPALFLTLLYVHYTNINNEPVNIPRPSIAYWTDKLLTDRESKEVEMGGYGNATVRTNDSVACSSRQGVGNDEAVLEGNESEAGEVDEQTRKLEEIIWEIDFNFKEVSKAKKKMEKLLELGVNEYPDSKELKERIAKHISVFGGDKRPQWDDESNEGGKTPIHNPSHITLTTPGGQDSVPKENNGDKGKQKINEGCVDGAEEGHEEDSVPSMTQLLTPGVFDNLESDALAKRSGSRSLEPGFTTPEVVPMMQDDSDVNDDDIIDVMPLRYVPATHGKRKIKPTFKAKSPYFRRVVDSGAQMQDLEMRVSGWVFSGKDSQWDIIYRNKFNDTVCKGVFESMIPGSCVHGNAIDVWAMQLSSTESFRSRSSPVRVFMPSTILSNRVLDEKYTKESRYKLFETRVNTHLDNYPDFGDILISDLVFFPVLQSEHFYLIVFNIKRIECAVIDNSLVDVPMDAKYGSAPLDMVDFFTRYMSSRNHPKAQKFKNMLPCRFYMPWMTKKNKVDCGVFVMRHMETYKGEKMEKWDASLELECESLQEQLNELRWKYVTKMLLSDMNLLKEYVEGKMDVYVNIPERMRKKFGQKSHLETIEIRLKTLS
ncbi:hypothetical protein LXL04_004830 [Taraxacum kok-saghyz]